MNKITLAKHGGFCFGVKRALDKVIELSDKDVSISTLGPIIHNPLVVNMLIDRGVKNIDTPSECESTHLVIRSHGVSPCIYDQAKQSGLEIVDVTCPYVRRIQEKAAQCKDDGIQLIIVGESSHPETIGIAGWYGDNAIIINSIDEAADIENIQSACVVAQTTTQESKFISILEKLKDKVVNLEIFNSICSATKARQQEAIDIAKECDIVFVVGGRNSSNTCKLYSISSLYCENSYHIESTQDIPSLKYSEYHHLGIISGASTPEWIIKEVYCTMSDIEKLETTDTPVPVAEEVEVAQPAEEAVAETTPEAAPVAEEVVVEATESVEETASEETPEVASEEETAQEEILETASDQESADEDSEEEVSQASFMEDVEKSMITIKSGMVLTGKVVSVNEEEVCVNIGYKADGIITRKEFSANAEDNPVELVKEGDDIEVEVVRVKDEDGNVLLSRKNVEARKSWKQLVKDFEAGCEFKGTGKQAVKGGLIANINGVRAFVPASHLDVRYVNDITEYIGKEMDLKILEVEKHRRRVVASRKQYIIDKEKEAKSALWDQVVEGITVLGVVRRITNFGAFVDIGGIDGLVHVTDLAWGRVEHPRDVVSINDEINVVVLKVDKERERISLGYKQTKPKPWDIADEKYLIGSVVEGKVVRIVPFGAFVELEPGLDGLVHISQIADRRIDKVEDAIKLGDVIQAKVLDVNATARRISLSIRELLAPSDGSEDGYGEDDYNEGASVLVDITKYDE